MNHAALDKPQVRPHLTAGMHAGAAQRLGGRPAAWRAGRCTQLFSRQIRRSNHKSGNDNYKQNLANRQVLLPGDWAGDRLAVLRRGAATEGDLPLDGAAWADALAFGLHNFANVGAGVRAMLLAGAHDLTSQILSDQWYVC